MVVSGLETIPGCRAADLLLISSLVSSSVSFVISMWTLMVIIHIENS